MNLVEKFEKKKIEYAKKYVNEGKISKGLTYILEDIVTLKNKGLKEKEIFEFIKQELNLDIKLSSFHSFWYRKVVNYNPQPNNIENIQSKTPTQNKPKSNFEEEKKFLKPKKVEGGKINSATTSNNAITSNKSIEEKMSEDIDISKYL